MFPSFPQQASSGAASNYQLFVNVSKRYASGLQQLAELNVQTIKTVMEESTSVLKAGTVVKPGEFLSLQPKLLAALPEKAAAYSRHFLNIVRSTETDILNETRSQFGKYGFNLKGVFETAAQQSEVFAKGPVALLSNAAKESADAADETAAVVVDASGEIAQKH